MRKPELNEDKLTIEVFNKLLGEQIVEVRKKFISKNIPMHKIVDGKIVAIYPTV